MRLSWTAELETGIRQIDLQHRELIELIAEFETAHEAGNAMQMLGEILQRLAAYALFHFATEEALMHATPSYQWRAVEHIREHQAFVEKVTALKAMNSAAGQVESAALLDYLKQWLVEHIMKTDKQFARLIATVPAAELPAQ